MDDVATIARSQAGLDLDSPPGGPGATERISPRVTRARLVRLFVISAVVISAAIILGTIAIISSLRNQALVVAKRQVADVAFMLAEQTDRSLQAVELLEKNLIGRMRRLDIASIAAMEKQLAGYDAHVLLKDIISGLPHVASVALIDADGTPISLARVWPLPPLSRADRDYYKARASDPQRVSFLGAPVQNRVDQERSIYL